MSDYQLQAGPIRVNFQDGELRYLYVGGREIVRRIYFAVRDANWDTAMPEFSRLEVRQQADSFQIWLEATARNPLAAYRWSGEITGTADGRITFAVRGQAVETFSSPRIGLNILYGADALAGQAYETLDARGAATAGVFPRAVDPQELFAVDFRALRYTVDGMTVQCAVTGARIDMEDQRNFCDSSYKALSWLPYPYPEVPAQVEHGETLTLTVTHAPAATPGDGVTRVMLDTGRRDPSRASGSSDAGGPYTGWMPALLTANGEENASFVTLNRGREPFVGADEVAWAFNPAAHMPDDDTFMENITAVVDQAATVRTFAPAARLRVAPIGFDSPYPRPARDARNQQRFAAAWTAALAGELARADVEEATFATSPGADPILRALQELRGCPLRPVTVTGPLPAPLRAFAVIVEGETRLWLINITARSQSVQLALPPTAGARVCPLAPPDAHYLPAMHGATRVELPPFGVYQVVIDG